MPRDFGTQRSSKKLLYGLCSLASYTCTTAVTGAATHGISTGVFPILLDYAPSLLFFSFREFAAVAPNNSKRREIWIYGPG